jgi:hypothetical protein
MLKIINCPADLLLRNYRPMLESLAGLTDLGKIIAERKNHGRGKNHTDFPQCENETICTGLKNVKTWCLNLCTE